MSALPPLPAPARSVRSPAVFAVSALGRAADCPLSVALDAVRDAPRLAVHPRALYGRALHGLVEAAVCGRVDGAEGFAVGARRFLAALVDALPGGTPPPALVYGALGWRRRVADVVAVAQAVAQPSTGPLPRGPAWVRAHDASMRDRAGVNDAAWRAGDGRWAEVALASEQLRLTGRADLVERAGRSVQITDLKTGSAATPDGGAAPHVALQLRAYGLVVAELLPGAQIKLCVAARSSMEVPFGPNERATAERVVRALAARLPAGADVAAADLAAPGPACRLCAHRHRCRAYLEVAPSWWRDGADHPFPTDVWGEAEAVTDGPRGLTTLALRDASGRRVRITGLRAGASVARGQIVYAFGLEEPVGRWRPGRRTSPLSYRDVDSDSGTAAWSLELYEEPANLGVRSST